MWASFFGASEEETEDFTVDGGSKYPASTTDTSPEEESEPIVRTLVSKINQLSEKVGQLEFDKKVFSKKIRDDEQGFSNQLELMKGQIHSLQKENTKLAYELGETKHYSSNPMLREQIQDLTDMRDALVNVKTELEKEVESKVFEMDEIKLQYEEKIAQKDIDMEKLLSELRKELSSMEKKMEEQSLVLQHQLAEKDTQLRKTIEEHGEQLKKVENNSIRALSLEYEERIDEKDARLKKAANQYEEELKKAENSIRHAISLEFSEKIKDKEEELQKVKSSLIKARNSSNSDYDECTWKRNAIEMLTEQVTNTELQLSNAMENNLRLQNRNIFLGEELRKLNHSNLNNSKLASDDTSLEKLRDEMRQLDIEYHNVLEQNKELLREKNNISESNNSLLQKLKEEHRQLEDEYQRVLEFNKTIVQNKEKTEMDLDAKINELNIVNQKLADAQISKEDACELQLQLDGLININQSLQKENNELISQKEIAYSSSVQDKIHHFQEKIDISTAANKALEEEKKSIEDNYIRLKSQLTNDSSKEEYLAEIVDLKEQLRELSECKTSLEAGKKFFENKISDFESNLDAELMKNDLLEKELHDISSTKESLTQDILNLENEVSILHCQLKDKNEELVVAQESLSNQNVTQTAEVDRLTSIKATLEDKIIKCNQEIELLKSSSNDSTTYYKDLQVRLDEALSIRDRLDEENNGLQSDKVDLQSQVLNLENKIVKFKDELKNLAVDNDDLRSKLYEASQSKEQLLKELNDSKSIMQECEDKNRRMELEMETIRCDSQASKQKEQEMCCRLTEMENINKSNLLEMAEFQKKLSNIEDYSKECEENASEFETLYNDLSEKYEEDLKKWEENLNAKLEESLAKEAKRFQEQLNDKSSLIESLQFEKNEQIMIVENLEKEFKICQEKVNELNEKIFAQEAHEQSLRLELLNEQELSSTKDKKIAESEGAIATANEKAHEMETQLNTQSKEFATSCEKLRKTIDIEINERRAAEEKSNKMSMELEKKDMMLKLKEDEVRRLECKVNSYVSEHEQISNNLQLLIQRESEIQARCTALDDECSRLRGIDQQRTLEFEQYGKQLEEEKDQTKRQYDEENHRLQMRVEELEKQKDIEKRTLQSELDGVGNAMGRLQLELKEAQHQKMQTEQYAQSEMERLAESNRMLLERQEHLEMESYSKESELRKLSQESSEAKALSNVLSSRCHRLANQLSQHVELSDEDQIELMNTQSPNLWQVLSEGMEQLKSELDQANDYVSTIESCSNPGSLSSSPLNHAATPPHHHQFHPQPLHQPLHQPQNV